MRVSISSSRETKSQFSAEKRAVALKICHFLTDLSYFAICMHAVCFLKYAFVCAYLLSHSGALDQMAGFREANNIMCMKEQIHWLARMCVGAPAEHRKK